MIKKYQFYIFVCGQLIGATTLLLFGSLAQIKYVTLISLLGAVLFVGILAYCRVITAVKICFILLLGAILGLSASCVQAQLRLSWQLPSYLENQISKLEGEVVSIVKHHPHSYSFDFRLVSINDKPLGKFQSAKIRLQSKTKLSLAPHSRLKVLAKLNQPWHDANPGGFDRQKHMFVNGYRATGKISQVLEQSITSKNISFLVLRSKINNFLNCFKRYQHLDIIQALSIGLTDNISAEKWQVFQNTGTSHLVAISGLHIGLVASMCYLLGYQLCSRCFFLTCRAPASSFAAFFAIIGALYYSALAGFALPTLRACIMIIIAMLAKIYQRKVLSWQVYFMALFVVLLLEPLAPFRMGFWLSFGCVAFLIYSKHFYTTENKLKNFLMPQLIIFLGMMPISALFFQKISLVSPIANSVAIFCISTLVVPLCLTAVVIFLLSKSLAAALICIAHKILIGLWIFLAKLSSLNFAVIHWPAPAVFAVILATIGCLILLQPPGFPLRWVGLLGILSLVVPEKSKFNQGDFRFTVLDIGQGLCAVVQTKQHVLLYDTGPGFNNSDKVDSVIKPFLIAQNIKTIDKIVISHTDLDHRGGLKKLMKQAYVPVISSDPINLKECSSTLCNQELNWQWDGVNFNFMNLNPNLIKKRNDKSCVLKISNNDYSVMLAGDIEKTMEKKLFQQHQYQLAADILLVPHHGSLSSSTSEFINAVKPSYAVYAVGKNNLYGFPKLSVLQKYSAIGCQNLISYKTGAIAFKLAQKAGQRAGNDKQIPKPQCWRQHKKRFWHNTD